MAVASPDESPQAFALRVRDALLRVAALFVMGAAHRALMWGLDYVVPANFDGAKVLLEDVSFVTFSMIFLYLLWDMLKVFVPWLQAKPYPAAPGKKK